MKRYEEAEIELGWTHTFTTPACYSFAYLTLVETYEWLLNFPAGAEEWEIFI